MSSDKPANASNKPKRYYPIFEIKKQKRVADKENDPRAAKRQKEPPGSPQPKDFLPSPTSKEWTWDELEKFEESVDEWTWNDHTKFDKMTVLCFQQEWRRKHPLRDDSSDKDGSHSGNDNNNPALARRQQDTNVVTQDDSKTM